MTNKIVMDIESMEHFANAAGVQLHDYQKAILSKGFGVGELQILMAGRGTGKSALNYYTQKIHQKFSFPPMRELTSSTVDGDLWHTLQCNNVASTWLRTQNTSQWYEHQGQVTTLISVFDVSDKLYTFMRIKFSA